MADRTRLSQNSVALQREMFRLAENEHGLSLAVLARTRAIPHSTLKGWREGTAMPAWALGALDLPDDLTSLVLSPYEKHVGTDEDSDGDCDELAEAALEVAHEVSRARSQNSPGGPAIVHIEREQIRRAARRLAPKARKVAA